MAFPTTPLPIAQQVMINGVWVDFTDDTRGAGGVGGVTITRGYSGEQSQLSAGQAAFVVNNRDGKYTNDNPTSSLYRLLGRNTPYRTGVDSGTVSARFLGATAAGSTAYDGSVIWTADKAALDITGDLDLAVDVDISDTTRNLILMSKYLIAGDQRSWMFAIDHLGYLRLLWSTDGTLAGRLDTVCPVPVDLAAGRQQFRVQLDVNNGSGGWTCSFYTGTGSIGLSYNFLGSTSGTGVTSVFSSSARVECGDANNAAGFNGTLDSSDPFTGKFYAATIRATLNGTLVALMNAYQQTAGTTSWADTTATANTWNVTGSTELTGLDFRFRGDVPSWPNRWDTSGTDIYIPVTANDIIARLTSGTLSKPIESAVKHNLKQFAWDGYWPLEQPIDSSTISAYYGQPGQLSNANFSTQPTDFQGSAGSLIFSDDTGVASGTANPITGAPTLATYLFYFKLDTIPATSQTIMQFFMTGGTAQKIVLQANTTQFTISINASDGTVLAGISSSFGGSNSPSNWMAMRVKLSSSGGTVTWEWAWYQIDSPAAWGTSGTYSGTVGRPWYWSSPGYTGKFNYQIAHVAMGRLDPDILSSDFQGSTNGFNLERWDDRARRVGAQTGIPVFIEGNPITALESYSHLMGPQGLKTPVDLLQECADVAGGMMYAPRDRYGITIRSWEMMINRDPVTFDYAANHLSGSLQPEPDLFLIENDVTLQTPDGSTYRYVKTDGTLNTGDPGSDPDAVGIYDVGPVPINLGIPSDMEQYAQRRVLFGTWDEARYPTAQIQLERAPFVASAALTAAARRLDLGRPYAIANPPSWLPPGTIGQMITGYVETLGGFTQTLVFNARPSGPWNTGTWGSAAAPTTSLWGAKSTTLKTGVNSTATALTLTTPDVREVWSTTASGYPIQIAGEVMTVTSVGARTGTGPYSQVVNVTRSVNGVVKSLNANEPVTVVSQGRWS